MFKYHNDSENINNLFHDGLYRILKSIALLSFIILTMITVFFSVSMSTYAKTYKSTYKITKDNKKYKKTLSNGDVIKLTIKSGSKKINFKDLTIKSSNKKIVSVSKDKKTLTAHKKGTAKITVLSKKNKKLKCVINLTVKNKSNLSKLKKLTIIVPSTFKDYYNEQGKSMSLYIGDTLTLSYKADPSDADTSKVKWSSSNSSVVTINQSGTINCLAEGSATIYVKDTKNNVEDSLSISVNRNPANDIERELKKFNIRFLIKEYNDYNNYVGFPDNSVLNIYKSSSKDKDLIGYYIDYGAFKENAGQIKYGWWGVNTKGYLISTSKNNISINKQGHILYDGETSSYAGYPSKVAYYQSDNLFIRREWINGDDVYQIHVFGANDFSAGFDANHDDYSETEFKKFKGSFTLESSDENSYELYTYDKVTDTFIYKFTGYGYNYSETLTRYNGPQ